MTRHARQIRLASLTFVAVALTLSVARTAAAQDMGIKVGATAPDAVVESMQGAPMDLAGFYGDKPVVLEFWATWCPLCKQLEPAMHAAREKYDGMVTFVSVGVAANQTPERQMAHATKQKMGGAFVFDRDGKATAAFGVPHTSYVVVIDRNRKVVYTGVGGTQNIEAAIRKASLE